MFLEFALLTYAATYFTLRLLEICPWGKGLIDYISTHAKIVKTNINAQELSKHQMHPSSRAFKVAVPNGKLDTCLKLQWHHTLKVQPFRQKAKGTTVGANRKHAFGPFTSRHQYNSPPGRPNGRMPYRNPQKFGQHYNPHPGSFNGRGGPYGAEWEWGYPYY